MVAPNWALPAVLLVAVLLRSIPAPAWGVSDAENYAAIAWRMSRSLPVVGEYAGPPHKPDERMGPRAFAIRPGVTFPASLVFRALPVNGRTAALYPLALGLSEVVLAFLLARRFAGPAAGVAAALLVATIPQAVIDGRLLRADLPSAAFAGWGAWAFLAALDRRSTAGIAAAGAGAGLLLGASWLSKETLVLMAPALIAAGAIAGWPRARTAAVAAASCAAGLAAVMAAESAFYAHRTGDPLFRFHELMRNFEQCRENFWRHGEGAGKSSVAIAWRLLLDGPATLLLSRPALGIGTAALAAGWWSIRRHRAALVPFAWLALLAVAFNFGSTSISEYRPLPTLSTYHYAMVLPGCVLLGVTAKLASTKCPRKAAAAVGVLACTYAIASVAVIHRNQRTCADMQVAVRAIPAGASVLTDYSSRMMLSYHLDGAPEISPRVRRLESVAEGTSGDFLLLVPGRLRDLQNLYGYRAPIGMVADLGWRPVIELGTLTLYRRELESREARDDVGTVPTAIASSPEPG